MSTKTKLTVLIVTILVLDQVLKVWIKTHMSIGEEFGILGLSWARIYFIENPGMAFGLKFGGTIGKLALTLFRVFAIGMLIYLINQLIHSKERLGVLICFSLILAGAIGNTIDSAFYGILFSASSPHTVAQFMAEDGGYQPLLQGWVVDMFYFPLLDVTFPQWLPLIGGRQFEFFKPVFNLADSYISIGVISILLFHRKFFTSNKKLTEVETPEKENDVGDVEIVKI